MKCKKIQKVKVRKLKGLQSGKTILFSKFAVCKSKKSKLFKQQKARGKLIHLTEEKIPTLSDLPIINTLF